MSDTYSIDGSGIGADVTGDPNVAAYTNPSYNPAFDPSGGMFGGSSMFDPAAGMFGGGSSLNDLMNSYYGGYGGVDPATGQTYVQQQAMDPGNQLGADQTGQTGQTGGVTGQTGQQTNQQQNQNQNQPQQQNMLSWLRSLQNPGAWTPGGTAQAAEGPQNAASFNQRFGDWSNFTSGAAAPQTMTNRSGTPGVATGVDVSQSAVPTPQADPRTQVPSWLGGGTQPAPSTQPGFESGVPTPQADPRTADPETGAPPDSPRYTSPSQQPQPQPGQQQPGQAQPGQQQPGQGQRPQNPIEQILRRAGLNPSLARLVSMAMMQGMRGRGGFPGGFPGMRGRGGFPGMRGGFPGMRGRGGFGGRGGFPMGGRGFPMMSRPSPLPRFHRGPMAPQGGGGFPWGGGGTSPQQPDTGDQGTPGTDQTGAPATAPQFAPDDAELAQAQAGQGGPAAPSAPATRATATPAGQSATGVPLSNISIPGSTGSVKVASDAAPAFSGFLNDLAASGAPLSDVGGYSFRNIAGTGQLSQHAFGHAIDVNQQGRNQVSPAFRQWAMQNRQLLANLTRKWGLVSGGDWRNPDFGHWEFRRRAYALQNPADAYAHGIGQ